MNGTTAKFSWDDLSYWQCGEWQVVQERLDDRDRAGIAYCPRRDDLFRALDLVPFDKVEVVIVGQDPYPNPALATGVAFSVPMAERIPPSLLNILAEAGVEQPQHGALEAWCKQGVLLWNAYPTCDVGNSASHEWPEWKLLTDEIITKLQEKGNVIFVFVGTKAQEHAPKFANPHMNGCEFINVGHPSPLNRSSNQFRGSGIFERINAALRERGKQEIDWRL
jgi:uracil-DNA glycosylase